jgi:mannose-6-phosphate isomerase-like protein (cupin superfamily)
MKTTPPPGRQEIPGVVADKRVLVRYRDLTRVDPCPFGQACRIVTGGEGGVANVHVITVSRGGLHFHRQYDEVYYVLAGSGTVTLAGAEYPLRPGAVVVIPAGVPHELCAAAAGPLEFVIFGTPPMAIDDPRARPERSEHVRSPDDPGCPAQAETSGVETNLPGGEAKGG